MKVTTNDFYVFDFFFLLSVLIIITIVETSGRLLCILNAFINSDQPSRGVLPNISSTAAFKIAKEHLSILIKPCCRQV